MRTIKNHHSKGIKVIVVNNYIQKGLQEPNGQGITEFLIYFLEMKFPSPSPQSPNTFPTIFSKLCIQLVKTWGQEKKRWETH